MEFEKNKETHSGKLAKSAIRNLVTGAIILVIVITGLIIILNKDSQINELQLNAQNLALVIHNRDSVINELDRGISEIEHNITFVKNKREQIEFNYQETGKNQKEQIIEDIAPMNTMLEESEQKMAELTKKLNTSEVEIKSFRNRVAKLDSELKNQTTIVSNLKLELEEKNVQLAALDKKLNELENVVEMQVDSIVHLTDSIGRTTEKINQAEHDLNKAYLVQGTFKELKENDVLLRSGGFLGIGKNKKLKNNFNEEHFTELDIRETEIIPLNVKKAEILSEHANHSYRFIYQDNLITYLKIEDPNEFWKRTKYAVIEIK